jgi:plasmid stability protein
MAELLVRDVEPAILAELKKRAEEHRRTIEDEHRAILRDVLLAADHETPAMTFEAYLRKMPDVGTDADFSRIDGSIRDDGLGQFSDDFMEERSRPVEQKRATMFER